MPMTDREKADRPQGNTISRYLFALLFCLGGINHFINPAFYIGIMPEWLGAKRELVLLTGVLEIAGGIGLLVPAVRLAAGWGLMAFLWAVLVVHVEMVIRPEKYLQMGVPYWALVARLLLQFFLMAWLVWAVPLAGRMHQNAIVSKRRRDGGL